MDPAGRLQHAPRPATTCSWTRATCLLRVHRAAGGRDAGALSAAPACTRRAAAIELLAQAFVRAACGQAFLALQPHGAAPVHNPCTPARAASPPRFLHLPSGKCPTSPIAIWLYLAFSGPQFPNILGGKIMAVLHQSQWLASGLDLNLPICLTDRHVPSPVLGTVGQGTQGVPPSGNRTLSAPLLVGLSGTWLQFINRSLSQRPNCSCRGWKGSRRGQGGLLGSLALALRPWAQ